MGSKKGFWAWIQSPAVGQYSGRIVLGIFSMMGLGIAAFVKFGTVNAGATNGVDLNENGINEVRMTSVEYVLNFETDVDEKTQEAILDYVYQFIDKDKLLHMVNMRQHIVFTKEGETGISADRKFVYIPVSSPTDTLWELLDLLE